jgi:lipopolysaccharide export system permease protein
MENLAARDNAMLPMIWLQAVVPGMICAWMLFGSQWFDVRRHLVEAS